MYGENQPRISSLHINLLLRVICFTSPKKLTRKVRHNAYRQNGFTSIQIKFKASKKNMIKWSRCLNGNQIIQKKYDVLWCKLNGLIDSNVFPFSYPSIHVVIFEEKNRIRVITNTINSSDIWMFMYVLKNLIFTYSSEGYIDT